MARGTAERPSPYVWATWLTGLLSADDNCRWAPWFKAHHTYDKREDGGFDLVKWKSEHGDMVRQRVEELRADGWTVTIEGQNKFTVRGKVVTLAGQADILAVKGLDALVVDCKGGKRKAKDVWQVCLYMFALPLAGKVPEGVSLRGEVRYTDGAVEVPAEKFGPKERARVLALLAEAGGSIEPERVPSAPECRFCDIAACPVRVTEREAEVACAEF